GEFVSFSAIFFFYPTHFNIHFTLFLTTFLFLLTMCLYDIHSMHIDLRLLFVYTIVSVFVTQTYFGNFVMIFLISHVIYLFASKFIGYGDILLFNILGLIFPLNFFFFIVVFTFIIGGIFAIILKFFSFKD
ncbi:prepilin peptidase, partial [Bacillus cereus]